MSEVLFVIGLGRSGTTLLQSMLNAHSKIAFVRETHFIKKYVYPEISEGVYQRSNPEVLKEALKKDEQVTDVCKDIDGLFEKLEGNKNDYLTAEIFQRLMKQSHPNVAILGDKDPMNVNFITTMAKAFPSAKVLHIIRDPRDVIASRKKSDWGKKTLLLTHIAEYLFGIRKARREGAAYFRERYYECRYEDLVLEEQNTLADICDFLGISYEEAMQKHYEKAGELIREDEMKWKANVLKPVTSESIGKWKKDLKTSQIRRIELSLKKEMADLGYQRAMKIPFLLRMCYLPMVSLTLKAYDMKFGNG